MVIADMVYNLGQSGFFSKFPDFEKAVKHRDWKTAAAESSRVQVQDSRNTNTAGLLHNAATLDDKKNYFFISTNKKLAKANLSVVIKSDDSLGLRVTARIP